MIVHASYRPAVLPVNGSVVVAVLNGNQFSGNRRSSCWAAVRFDWPTLWIYLVVQFGAGALAGLTFLGLNPGDK